MPTLPQTTLSTGQEMCMEYVINLCLCYGISAISETILLCLAWWEQSKYFAHLCLTVVTWIRFLTLGSYTIFLECGAIDSGTNETVNSIPSYLFMAACSVVILTLASPFLPTQRTRNNVVLLGFILVAFNACFDVSLFVLSLSMSIFTTGGGIAMYVLFGVYYTLGALGFAYAGVVQKRELSRFGLRSLELPILGLVGLCIGLLSLRAGALYIGASVDPFNVLLLEFWSYDARSNIYAYYYYLITELLVIVVCTYLLFFHRIAEKRVLECGDRMPVFSVSADTMSRRCSELSKKTYENLFAVFPQIKRTEIILGDAVGQGSFATVYRAQWHGTDVAVKLFHVPLEFATPRVIEDVAEEMAILRDARHPNVLQYLGTTPPPSLSIVTEFMEMGNLEGVLREGRYREALRDCSLKSNIAVQICRGMTYLHQRGILHRDLCATNIMVGRGWVVKIGDLGLARVKEASRPMTKMTLGTPPYIAPEVIDQQLYSTKSDVYSFGIILWVLVTQNEPWEMAEMTIFNLFSRVQSGERPSTDIFANPPIVKLLNHSWCPNPEERTSFSAILDVLSTALCFSITMHGKACPNKITHHNNSAESTANPRKSRQAVAFSAIN